MLDSDFTELLEFDGLKALLGHLKVRIGPLHLSNLQAKLENLTGSSEGPIDIVNFLRLMRWMLDTNFANLNARCSAIGAGASIHGASATGDTNSHIPSYESAAARRASC